MDFNGSFSYGALVNNDGVAPATPPITLEEPAVRSRSTDSSAGTNNLKRDWSSIFEVCLERPLGFLCQFCWPRPCPAAPGVQWLMGVQDVISLCLTPLLPEISKPKCNLRDIFLLETMLAVFWGDRTSQRADLTWVTLQQSRCCALRFPAVKFCSHSLVHETTKFTNNTLSVLPMRCSSKPACEQWCHWMWLHARLEKLPMKMPASSSFLILLFSSSDSFNEVSKGCNLSKLL